MNNNTGYRRQWHLLQYIANTPKGVTIAELANLFNVSTKTIRRDIILLKMIPITLREEHVRGNYKRIFYDYKDNLFPLNLNRDELLAFYVGQNLMQPLQGTYFWDGIQSGIGKIRQVLDIKVIEYAERISPLFYRLDRSIYDYNTQRDIIDTILISMEDSREVQIQYKSVSSNNAKCYQIHPYSFVFYQDYIYIVGYSCKNKEIRFWKINRLIKATLQDNKFTKPADFKVDRYLSQTFCPFVGNQEIIEAKIIFSPKIAQTIQELAWDSFKSIKHHNNGSLEVIIKTENSKPFLHWLLSFGADIEVLEPQKLRDSYFKKIQDILAKYQ